MLFRSLIYLLLFSIGWIDSQTGMEVQFGSLYLLTIGLAAWNFRGQGLVVFSVITVVVWVTTAGEFPEKWMLYWNIFNRTGSVSIMAVVVSIVKSKHDRQQELISELKQTALMASHLKEVIPVCRLCHQIRPGNENDLKLRNFLGENEGDDSFGGICEVCLETRQSRIAKINIQNYFEPDQA